MLVPNFPRAQKTVVRTTGVVTGKKHPVGKKTNGCESCGGSESAQGGKHATRSHQREEEKVEEKAPLTLKKKDPSSCGTLALFKES